MIDLSEYTVKQLKELIQNYNLHYHIKNYSKKTRKELEEIIKDFMDFINDKIVNKKVTEVEAPKPNVKKVKQVVVKKKVNTKEAEEEEEEDKEENPLDYVRLLRKEIDDDVEKYNSDAKKLFDDKQAIAKKEFEERRAKGEKITKAKLDTMKKNAINKNPAMKKRYNEVLEKAGMIETKVKELEKYGLSAGLSYGQLSPFVSHLKMYAV